MKVLQDIIWRKGSRRSYLSFISKGMPLTCVKVMSGLIINQLEWYHGNNPSLILYKGRFFIVLKTFEGG